MSQLYQVHKVRVTCNLILLSNYALHKEFCFELMFLKIECDVDITDWEQIKECEFNI